MTSGVKINITENRAVLHTALRSTKDQVCHCCWNLADALQVINVDGENVVPEVHKVLDSIKVFSDKVRSGELRVCYRSPSGFIQNRAAPARN